MPKSRDNSTDEFEERTPLPIAERIRERLRALNKSPTAASLEATGNEDAIRNIFKAERSGKAYSPRGDTISKLATVLGTTVEWLIEGTGIVDVREPFAHPKALDMGEHLRSSWAGLPYAGKVEAGAFRDVDVVDEYVGRRVAVPKDPRYPDVDQYVWLVQGDSMNERGLHPGMFVVGADIVAYEDMYQPVNNGDLVVVERVRFAGQEIERTVKEIHRSKSTIELRPRSTNKSHKTIKIKLGGEDDQSETVAIKAVVLSAHSIFGNPYIEFDVDNPFNSVS